MNIIVSVATKDNDRIHEFLDDISKCYLDQGDKICILKTGENIDIPYTWVSNAKIEINQGKVGYRLYADVLKEKNDIVRQYAQSDTIIVNVDDDYSFNPYVFRVIKKAMLENTTINYMSVVKAHGICGEVPTEIISGFRFIKLHSCMGGSIISRWSVFNQDVDNFIDNHGSANMFDTYFFNSLSQDPIIYTLDNLSLMQHCNLVSSYLDQKGSKLEHMYGVDFDPRINPFKVFDIQE